MIVRCCTSLHKLFASVNRPAEQHRIVPLKTLGNVHTISFSLPPCHRQAPENLYDEHVLCAFLDDGFLLADRTARASCVVLVDIVREIARRVPRPTAIRQTSLNLTSSCLSPERYVSATYVRILDAGIFFHLPCDEIQRHQAFRISDL